MKNRLYPIFLALFIFLLAFYLFKIPFVFAAGSGGAALIILLAVILIVS